MAESHNSVDQVNATDAGAASLMLSAALFQALRRKGLLTPDEANDVVTRAYQVLVKSGSPGGAKALQRVLGAKLSGEV